MANFVLSEADVLRIAEAIVTAENIRASSPEYDTDKPHEMSPEFYIIKGKFPPGSRNNLSKETVPVYKLRPFGKHITSDIASASILPLPPYQDEIIPVLLPNGKQKELEVFNVRGVAIGEGVDGDYNYAHRDKFGRWIVECLCDCPT